MLSAPNGLTVLVSNFEAEALASNFMNRSGKSTLNLVTPEMRWHQSTTLPSLPNRADAPIAVRIFAGSAHGPEGYLANLRSFLGLCERMPSSPVWRELFETRHAIESDGFVPPEFRAEVCQKLGVQIGSAFDKSPAQLLQCLFAARHLSEDLQSSPVGNLIGAADICRQGKTARMSVLK